jgi:ABC-type nitrate/sulfonate/bicarbonate transport system permease component
MRLGLGFAWVVIVVGEMTGVQTGLGRDHHGGAPALAHRNRDLGMIVIGAFGFSVRSTGDADRAAASGVESVAWLKPRSRFWK